MEYLRIKNWDTFQHYKQRNPPWIKLHNQLLSNYEFSCLQDASKSHLILIWLLASQCDNKIPNDPAWIQRKIGSDSKPDINQLIDLGFIECYQVASSALAERKQVAAVTVPPDREETETENKNILCENGRKNDRQYLNGHTRFNDWWNVYPKHRRIAKKRALEIWRAKHLDEGADVLIADVTERMAKDQKWIDGYVPNPTTYLNQHRWEDAYTMRGEKR